MCLQAGSLMQRTSQRLIREIRVSDYYIPTADEFAKRWKYSCQTNVSVTVTATIWTTHWMWMLDYNWFKVHWINWKCMIIFCEVVRCVGLRSIFNKCQAQDKRQDRIPKWMEAFSAIVRSLTLTPWNNVHEKIISIRRRSPVRSQV